MKKFLLKALVLPAFTMMSFVSFTNAGACTDTGIEDNGCKLYDCEDSFLIECPDGSKEVIIAKR